MQWLAPSLKLPAHDLRITLSRSLQRSLQSWRKPQTTSRPSTGAGSCSKGHAPRSDAAQKISNSPAAPMPPPMHMVTMPHFAPRRLPSNRICAVMRAPDMP